MKFGSGLRRSTRCQGFRHRRQRRRLHRPSSCPDRLRRRTCERFAETSCAASAGDRIVATGMIRMRRHLTSGTGRRKKADTRNSHLQQPWRDDLVLRAFRHLHTIERGKPHRLQLRPSLKDRGPSRHRGRRGRGDLLFALNPDRLCSLHARRYWGRRSDQGGAALMARPRRPRVLHRGVRDVLVRHHRSLRVGRYFGRRSGQASGHETRPRWARALD